MRDRLRIVVGGLVAQYPLGGVAWDYLQYAAGLARLGHDVYYVEDTGQWPYNPLDDGLSPSCKFNVVYLHDVMSRFGLGDRWAYRFAWDGEWFGMADELRSEIFRTADVVLNVSGVLRDPRSQFAGRLCYLDTDPVFTQVKLLRGQQDFQRYVDDHDVHFSFGEALSGTDLRTGHDWLPTRQPVLLSEWSTSAPPGSRYTTVMNWSSYNDVQLHGRRYGQKAQEFTRFIDLPERTGLPFEVAMAQGKNVRAPVELLRRCGWSIVAPNDACADLDSYRNYLTSSRAEWSVAKHGYVAGRSGWFSCRSACYLAASRPVVVQSTGFEDVIPVGEGILVFDDPASAVEALTEVERHHSRHCSAALELAHAYFNSSAVLTSLLERAVGTPSRYRVENPDA